MMLLLRRLLPPSSSSSTTRMTRITRPLPRRPLSTSTTTTPTTGKAKNISMPLSFSQQQPHANPHTPPPQPLQEASSFTLRRLTGALGAEITHLSLASHTLKATDKDDIRKAFLEHSVLIFRNQPTLTHTDLLKIAEIFGEVEETPVVKAQYGLPTVHDLVREPGMLGHYGEVWHQDCSYMKHPPLGALLYGLEVPSFGNDTVFCNMSLALETLSPRLVEMLESLQGVHSAFKMVDKDPEARYLDYDNVEHPVVRTHPETGKKSLFINPFFTKRFVGMTEEESKPILEHLFQVIARAELQCRVRWEKGSLCVWDNRCVTHQAIRDNSRERRVMRRVEIKGDLPQ